MPLIGLNQGISGVSVPAAAPTGSGLVRGRPILQNGNLRSDIGTTLRGVTMALDGLGSVATNYTLNRSNWQMFRDLKFNLVRLPFSLSYEGVSLSQQLPNMDAVVANASATGMYVMFMLDGPYGQANWSENNSAWPTIATRYKDNTNVFFEQGNEWHWSATEYGSGELDSIAALYNSMHSAAPNTFIGLLTPASVDDTGGTVSAMDAVKSRVGAANFGKAFLTYHAYTDGSWNSGKAQTIKNSYPSMMTETTFAGSSIDDPVNKIPGIDALGVAWCILSVRWGEVRDANYPMSNDQDSLTDRIIPSWHSNGFDWPLDVLTNNPTGVVIKRALPAGMLWDAGVTFGPGAHSTTSPGAIPGRAFAASSAVAKGALVGTTGTSTLPKSIALNPANPGSIQQPYPGAPVSWTTQIVPTNLTAGVSWAIITASGSQRGATTNLAKNNSSYTISPQFVATGDFVRVWETGNTGVNIDSGPVTVVASNKSITITPMSPGTIDQGTTVPTQIRAVQVPNVTYAIVDSDGALRNGQTSVAMTLTGQTRTPNIAYNTSGQFLRVWDTSNAAFKVEGNAVTVQQPAPTGNVFFEDFNNGPGQLSHVWGNSNTLSFSNGILRLEGIPGLSPDQTACGVMEFPGGPDWGHGYGYYEIRARHSDYLGDGSGVASLTWPADDQWPGAEEDMGEIGGDGTFYMAHHWNDGGNDAYEIFPFQYFNPNTWRTYGMRLKRDYLEYFVNGVSIGSTTNNVIRCYGDGPGYTVNRVFGVMIRSSNVWLECDWVRFTPGSP